MNIIEVKNNLVKLCYENDLALSELVLIRDSHQSYVAQVIHLEAARTGKIAVAKILYNYNGQILKYNGTIPSLRAEVEILPPETLLTQLDQADPVIIGKLKNGENIVADLSVFEENPIILAEKRYISKVMLDNFAIQIRARDKKVVIFDTSGVYKSNKLVVTKDFKLPLNYSTLNYIYEKGLEDATPESKTIMQSIFEELGEYAKTVDYIPFDSFKSVIDSEFERTKLIQLVVLKNRIKQIRDWNVFAQKEEDFNSIKEKLNTEDELVFDISCLNEALQKECIKYIYSVMKKIDTEFYSFTPLTKENSDKYLLHQIYNTRNVHTSVICDYDYSELSKLKKAAKNMFMFTPIKQQKDFGSYNAFLQILSEDEFIVYGKMSKFVPLISKIAPITVDDFATSVEEKPDITGSNDIEETLPEYTPSNNIEESAAEPEQVREEEVIPEADEKEDIITNQSTDTLTEELPAPEEPVEAEAEQTVTEITESSVEIDTIEAEEPEEISAPETNIISTPEVQVSQMASATAESVTLNKEDELQKQEQYSTPEPEVQNTNDNVESALEEVPEIEDDEELSDDDLDMIEQLSKPDEEISALNPETEEIEPVAEEPVNIVYEPAEAEAEIQTQEITEDTEPIQEPVAEEIPQEVPDAVTQEPEPAEEPQQHDIPKPEPIETRAKTTPSVPDYSAEIPEEDKVNSDSIQQGDRIFHQEFGEGVVEKLINYGDKILCSVNFPSVGRRLLNPEISEMKKIS